MPVKGNVFKSAPLQEAGKALLLPPLTPQRMQLCSAQVSADPWLLGGKGSTPRACSLLLTDKESSQSLFENACICAL